MQAPKENKLQPTFLKSLFRVALGRYDVLFASLAINVLSLTLPIVILQVYDKIIPNSAYNTFAYLIIGLAAAMILDAILRAIRTYITSWEGARFEHAISRRAADKLLSSKIEAFECHAAGTHLDRVTSIETLRDFHSGQGLIAVSDLPFVVLFLGLIAAIGGNLVLAPLAIVILAFFFAMILGKHLEKAIKNRAELDDQRYNFIFQTLNGIHSVKGLGMEAQLQRQYQSLLIPTAEAVRKVSFLSNLGTSLGTTFSNLAMVSVAAFGSLSVIDRTLSSGALIASTLLAGRAVQPLIRMITIWVQSQNLKLSEHRLDTLMSLPQEHKPDEHNHSADVNKRIQFENVTVHHGNTDIPILSDVNLTIDPGTIVALTGPMGGGKSMVLELLSGMVLADEGHVLFNDVDAKEIDFQMMRQQIGYARQETVMYRGTIAENMSGFRKHDRLPEALSTVHKLGLDEEIARMPLGLETPIGASATAALPSSIQQEISLCRVLSKKPKLLLLNEANSAFDFETDQRLRRLLIEMRGKTTVVMVSARPSIIALADKVYKVDHGKLSPVEGSKTSEDKTFALPKPLPETKVIS